MDAKTLHCAQCMQRTNPDGTHVETGVMACAKVSPMPTADRLVKTPYLVEAGTDTLNEATLRVFDTDGLAKYLTDHIEREHYSGDADYVHHIYRYERGELAELILVFNGQTRDETDFLYRHYRLHSKADAEGFGACDDNVEFGFTVGIDGRA